MANNPWDLMRELSSMQDRMNRMWGGVYDRGQEEVTSRGGWSPAVDVYETAGREVVLKIEIPGMRREDIDLTVEQNTLTVKGQRRRDDAIRDEQYHRVERAYGAFSRSFTLPNTLDAAGIRAEYRDGVLTVTVPVRQEAQPRQIKVELKD